jgi:integrase
MGRRGENIRKRKDGRWEARIIAGYDSKQKAKYYSVYGKTYSEVKAKKNAWLEDRLLAGTVQVQDYQTRLQVSFEQVCTEWLDFKQKEIKESSYAHYVHLVQRHLLPELGARNFSSIATEEINNFLQTKLQGNGTPISETKEPCNEIPKDGLSPKTVSDIRSVIVQILDFAKDRKYPVNITGKLFFPKHTQPAIRVLSKQEQLLLEEYAFQDQSPFTLGILLALYGGLRIGEICSLKWKDIHLKHGEVHIERTLLRIQETDSKPEYSPKTKLLLEKPKPANSIRTIPLPEFIAEHLKSLRQSPEIYVITGTTTWIEPRTCLDKYKKVLKKVGIDDYNFHALRHTFATRCIETGFDLKSLSEILGHANVNITLQRYVHPSMELKRQQMNRLETLSIRGQKVGQNNVKYEEN